MITDKNLQSFIKITDVLEGIFLALPASILEFLNNTMSKSWTDEKGSYNLFLLLAFLLTIINVLKNFLDLNEMLMNEKIEIFY